jgi:hypothetical protein
VPEEKVIVVVPYHGSIHHRTHKDTRKADPAARNDPVNGWFNLAWLVLLLSRIRSDPLHDLGFRDKMVMPPLVDMGAPFANMGWGVEQILRVADPKYKGGAQLLFNRLGAYLDEICRKGQGPRAEYVAKIRVAENVEAPVADVQQYASREVSIADLLYDNAASFTVQQRMLYMVINWAGSRAFRSMLHARAVERFAIDQECRFTFNSGEWLSVDMMWSIFIPAFGLLRILVELQDQRHNAIGGLLNDLLRTLTLVVDLNWRIAFVQGVIENMQSTLGRLLDFAVSGAAVAVIGPSESSGKDKLYIILKAALKRLRFPGAVVSLDTDAVIYNRILRMPHMGRFGEGLFDRVWLGRSIRLATEVIRNTTSFSCSVGLGQTRAAVLAFLTSLYGDEVGLCCDGIVQLFVEVGGMAHEAQRDGRTETRMASRSVPFLPDDWVKTCRADVERRFKVAPPRYCRFNDVLAQVPQVVARLGGASALRILEAILTNMCSGDYELLQNVHNAVEGTTPINDKPVRNWPRFIAACDGAQVEASVQNWGPLDKPLTYDCDEDEAVATPGEADVNWDVLDYPI